MVKVISGWYESDYGAELFCHYDLDNVQQLAKALYKESEGDCLGVDLEAEGEYSNGEEVNEIELLKELDNYL